MANNRGKAGFLILGLLICAPLFAQVTPEKFLAAIRAVQYAPSTADHYALSRDVWGRYMRSDYLAPGLQKLCAHRYLKDLWSQLFLT